MSRPWLSADEFEAVVSEELDRLPAEIAGGLENVAFVVEDEPDGGEDLLGRYDGVDLPHRDRYGFGELPDRIVVYRMAHLAGASDLPTLRAEVHMTLVHEIGHYYGLDDERLHELGWA